MNYKYEVIEDNAGGLHLFVFRNEPKKPVLFSRSGYEHYEGLLLNHIDMLRNYLGNITLSETDLQGEALYLELRWSGNLCKVIADQDGVYRDAMGAAGLREFFGNAKGE